MKTGNQTGLSIKLAKPAQRALAAAGIKNIEQFSKFTQNEIAQLHGIGVNALKAINEVMRAKGIHFKQ